MDGRWEDEDLLSEEMLDFFRSADHTCANVEGALIDALDDEKKAIIKKFTSDRKITRKDITTYAPIFPDKAVH